MNVVSGGGGGAGGHSEALIDTACDNKSHSAFALFFLVFVTLFFLWFPFDADEVFNNIMLQTKGKESLYVVATDGIRCSIATAPLSAYAAKASFLLEMGGLVTVGKCWKAILQAMEKSSIVLTNQVRERSGS